MYLTPLLQTTDSIKILWSAYFGDDYPAELPLPKPLQEVALSVEDPTLHYRINNTADWVSIFPKKHGFVRLGPEGRYFAVSMYHQLHCLNGLRRTLLASAPGRHQVMGEKVEDLHTMWLHEHTEHCLNFIRQALLCKADTTLEAAEYVRNPHGQLDWGANGLGVVHRCHDWTQVRDAVERNEQEWEARVIN